MRKNYQAVNDETIYSDKWLTLRKVKFSNGSVVKDYTLVDRNDSVIVIPMLPDGRFLLQQQFRMAAGRDFLEFPCGQIERGQTDLEAAKNELAEEANLHDCEIISLGYFSPNPGLSAQRVSVFLAKVRTKRNWSPTSVDANEGIGDYTRSTL